MRVLACSIVIPPGTSGHRWRKFLLPDIYGRRPVTEFYRVAESPTGATDGWAMRVCCWPFLFYQLVVSRRGDDVSDGAQSGDYSVCMSRSMVPETWCALFGRSCFLAVALCVWFTTAKVINLVPLLLPLFDYSNEELIGRGVFCLRTYDDHPAGMAVTVSVTTGFGPGSLYSVLR